ncbi:hypothetical protein AYI69_g10179 [Smittium culicis]|uniref:Uncharacterized protein n=1 Tax=Smittium culicis TaxID=133412 RepID=A0A1R1X7L6_9FUNG|nr:hypothetical protein AYI69_g10179 [Smittium culicis]
MPHAVTLAYVKIFSSVFSGRKDRPFHVFNWCNKNKKFLAAGSVFLTVDIYDFVFNRHLIFYTNSLFNINRSGSNSIDIACILHINLEMNFNVADPAL